MTCHTSSSRSGGTGLGLNASVWGFLFGSGLNVLLATANEQPTKTVPTVCSFVGCEWTKNTSASKSAFLNILFGAVSSAVAAS